MNLPSRDIHCHILPGVDDGFSNDAESLSAIRKMADNGCHEFVFTPHMNPDVYRDVDEGVLKSAYGRFSGIIPEEWGIKTSLAAEYMVVGGFEDKASSRADELLTYADGSILIEMSYYFASNNLTQSIFELNMAGLKPILAHPERYTYMSGSLTDFDRIADMGCRFQLNMVSLSGKYGKESVKIMDYLLDRGLYSFIASDLHSLSQLDRILAYKPGFFQKRKISKI